LIDGIEAELFGEVFNESLQIVDNYHVLDRYRRLDGGMLTALDGVCHHSSEKIHCKWCPHKTKEVVTTDNSTILIGTIVKSRETVVFPVMGS